MTRSVSNSPHSLSRIVFSAGLGFVLLATSAQGAALRSLPVEIPDAVIEGRWWGPDGEPLPFHSDEEVVDFLSTARLKSSQQLSSGINRPLKVLLEKDGVRAHAIFRTVDKKKNRARVGGKLYRIFHDSYMFECGAYKLSRLLGLDHVPPCVRRFIKGNDGTLQIWVEDAMTEKHRLDSSLKAPRPLRWARQRQTMYLFDSLIYNFDRNQGNMLITDDWKLWFIDHTRSFLMDSKVPALQRIVWCERALLEKLRALDPQLLQKELRPFVNRFQIKALLKRRDQIVAHLEGRMVERGEDGVIYDGADAEGPPNPDELAEAMAEASLPAKS